jgi:hypothetical protein
MPQMMGAAGHVPARVALAAAVFVALVAGAARLVQEPPIALESGPVMAPGEPARTPGAAGGAARGLTLTSVQVNRDANGMNVLGDAANEPSIAIDPTAPNRMAVGWRQFDTITSNVRQAGYSYSVDGGRTWAPKQVIEPGLFRTDPVLRSSADGTFHYSSLLVVGGVTFSTDLFTSTDGGATWPIKNFSFGGDKQWVAVDRSGGPGQGHVHQGWNTAGNQYFPAQFSRSVTGGSAWEQPVPYDPNSAGAARPVFGQVEVGPDGAVYVAGSNNSSNAATFWVVKSQSAQMAQSPVAFEQIVQVSMGGNLRLSQMPNPSGLMGQVNISIDSSGGPTHGNVYVLCSVDPPGSDPADVHLIRSTDGGVTWSPPVRVNDDPAGNNAWQWFGTMSVAPNGRIDVVWNDTRGSGAANISQLFSSHSDDAGMTWSPNVSMSPPFDSHLGWPQQNKLGDYYDMHSDLLGADLIWAATFNGEQDVYFLRIGPSDCNGNGVDDEVELGGPGAEDCDGNGIPDSCDIAAGLAPDDDGDGVPDGCARPCADVDGNGTVDVQDLVLVILAWGPCAACPEDLNGDGVVNVEDLVAIVLSFGPC